MLVRTSATLLLLAVVIGLTVRPAAAQTNDFLTATDDVSSQAGQSPLSAIASPAESCDFQAPDGCQPRWSARAGAIFLQRARPASTPFVFNANTNAPLIDPANFVFPFQAGADVGLIRYGDGADLDFRYFGINQASATQGPFNVGPGAAIAVSGLNGGSADPLSISSTYVTSLNSVESNLRRNVSSRLTLLAGFRYVSFRERLSGTGTDTISPDVTTVSFACNNNLYGMQIGADSILWDNGRRFRVEGVVKAGIFADSASSGAGITDNGQTAFTANSQTTHASFVGDVNFSGVYQLNRGWALRAGYQLLWLSGVATASEQLHDINVGGVANISTNTSHGVFFHGAMTGIERTW